MWTIWFWICHFWRTSQY